MKSTFSLIPNLQKLRNNILPLNKMEDILNDLYDPTATLLSIEYWLHLASAAGLATLGLILNSTAVIIGAMLISPLMKPINQLGMSFALGSIALALESIRLVFLSILFVILISFLISVGLPFHEITSEIAARTQPTVLDLSIALICGTALAITTGIRSGDKTSTVAGTAIAIALVPPLCVVGYSISSQQLSIGTGSFLLFVTNLAAISLMTSLCFSILGFGKVNLENLIGRVLPTDYRYRKIYLWSLRFQYFTRRPGWRILRIALPFTFVATLYVPLNHSFERVAWEISVRRETNAILDQMSKKFEIISKDVQVSYGFVTISLTILGENEKFSREDFAVKIAAISGVKPTIKIRFIQPGDAIDRKLESSASKLEKLLGDMNLKNLEKISPHQEISLSDALAVVKRDLFRDIDATLSTNLGSSLCGWYVGATTDDHWKLVICWRGENDIGPIEKKLLTSLINHNLDFEIETMIVKISPTIFETKEYRKLTEHDLLTLSSELKKIELFQDTLILKIVTPENGISGKNIPNLKKDYDKVMAIISSSKIQTVQEKGNGWLIEIKKK